MLRNVLKLSPLFGSIIMGDDIRRHSASFFNVSTTSGETLIFLPGNKEQKFKKKKGGGQLKVFLQIFMLQKTIVRRKKSSGFTHGIVGCVFLIEQKKAGKSIIPRDGFFISKQTVRAANWQVDLLQVKRLLCIKQTKKQTVS